LGLSGFLNRSISWKSLITWSRNFGSYQTIFPDPINEFSFLAECTYAGNKIPFEVKAGVAGDYGDRFEQRYGGYLGIGITF
jgi:hypothetical protein